MRGRRLPKFVSETPPLSLLLAILVRMVAVYQPRYSNWPDHTFDLKRYKSKWQIVSVLENDCQTSFNNNNRVIVNHYLGSRWYTSNKILYIVSLIVGNCSRAELISIECHKWILEPVEKRNRIDLNGDYFVYCRFQQYFSSSSAITVTHRKLHIAFHLLMCVECGI